MFILDQVYKYLLRSSSYLAENIDSFVKVYNHIKKQ